MIVLALGRSDFICFPLFPREALVNKYIGNEFQRNATENHEFTRLCLFGLSPKALCTWLTRQTSVTIFSAEHLWFLFT